MAQAQRVLAPDEGNGAERYGRHKLDEMDASRVARHLVMFRPTDAGVADLMAKARPAFPAWERPKPSRMSCGTNTGICSRSRGSPGSIPRCRSAKASYSFSC